MVIDINKKISDNKKEAKFDFFKEVVKRLLSDKAIDFYLEYKPNSIIPFPLVYRVFGYSWHFDKSTSLKILKELERRGFLEIKFFNGIKIEVSKCQEKLKE